MTIVSVPNKELKPKKNGAVYTVSPWSLTWDDANYYLIAYDADADCMKHYRVLPVLKDSSMYLIHFIIDRLVARLGTIVDEYIPLELSGVMLPGKTLRHYGSLE